VAAADLLNLLDGLFRSSAWPGLRVGLHVAFFLVLFYLLKLMFDFRDVTGLWHLAAPKRGYRVASISLAALFVTSLAYQATWQLAGVFRPEFITFMQLHDRRQFNPAHRIQRGRLLDHRGEVLAYSQEHQGQVYRLYPYGPAFAHVVGYSHPKFGAAGIEAAADAHLNGGAASLAGWGELGRRLVTQDKRPRGQDLTLTLDAELQQRAFELLGDRAGAVVLLRPDNGAVLVLVSTPAYDPNRISAALFQDDDPSAPLLNRATQGLYPPGSTFKTTLAALALDLGFSGTLHCPAEGFTTSSRYPKIRDHEYYDARREGRSWKGYGDLDLAAAFAKSSNVFFAQLGVRYGHDVFYENAERFYFNRQIPLYESPYGTWSMRTGVIPRIRPADQYGLAQMALGQGEALATPAHLALIAAAVANQGLAMKPRLVESDPPAPLARFMPATTAWRLAALMRKVITEGTGRGIDLKDLPIAGKTGTAETRHGEPHSWFIGFAPVERPALAVCVLIEHGGYGAQVAAPIARDLFRLAWERGLL